MDNEYKKATQEQIDQARKLLALAGLSADARMECEGMITVGIEAQVVGLTESLQKLIAEKEAAYADYKKAVKEAVTKN